MHKNEKNKENKQNEKNKNDNLRAASYRAEITD